MRVRILHSGPLNRRLATRKRALFSNYTSTRENEVRTAVSFRLSETETRLVDLVKEFCQPLFVVFDFAEFPDRVCKEIVT